MVNDNTVASMPGSENIELLSLFRGIACAGIMLFHYTCRFSELFSPAITMPICISFGYTFITYFLLLSGYLMYNSRNEKTFQFLKKKFFRLYPPYLISIILIFVVTTLWLEVRSVTPAVFAANIFLINTPLRMPYVDGAHWFIYTEAVFIVVFSIVNRAKKNCYKSLAWLLLSLLCLFLILANKVLDNRAMNFIYVCIQARYFPVLVTGYLLAHMRVQSLNRLHISTLIICALSQVLTLDVPNIISYTVFSLLFVLVARNSAFRRLELSRMVILKPFFALSTISYPVYLIHQNIGYAVLLALKSYWSRLGEAIILVPIIISIFLGIGLNQFVVKPVMAFQKKYNGGSKQ